MSLDTDRFQRINGKKANFDVIYSQPDPREYYRVLGGLDYVIPDLAKTLFRSLIEALCGDVGRAITVLDVGCSYGINAALLRYPLDIQRLSGRYASRAMQRLDTDELVELDAHYFRSWPTKTAARFVGLDSSLPALNYAQRTGLIDQAIGTDLERQGATPRDAATLRDVDLVISTGCVGYITERTFRAIFADRASTSMPWVASFVLRMFPYDAIAAELATHGLVTEKLEGVTFVQRRFHSEEELRSTLELLERRGIDPAGKESDGLFHAELYLSRPPVCVERMPLRRLVSVTSGANRRYGRRYARVAPREFKLVP